MCFQIEETNTITWILHCESILLSIIDIVPKGVKRRGSLPTNLIAQDVVLSITSDFF